MRRCSRGGPLHDATAYRTSSFASTTEATVSRAVGPYWAAPLQPSVVHVSQNCVRMYEGVETL